MSVFCDTGFRLVLFRSGVYAAVIWSVFLAESSSSKKNQSRVLVHDKWIESIRKLDTSVD